MGLRSRGPTTRGQYILITYSVNFPTLVYIYKCVRAYNIVYICLCGGCAKTKGVVTAGASDKRPDCACNGNWWVAAAYRRHRRSLSRCSRVNMANLHLRTYTRTCIYTVRNDSFSPPYYTIFITYVVRLLYQKNWALYRRYISTFDFSTLSIYGKLLIERTIPSFYL